MNRPIRVLHVTAVEADNYYLNNLADESPREVVEYSAVTFGKAGGFTEGLARRGIRAYALDALERRKYPGALPRFQRVISEVRPDIVHTHLFEPTVTGVTLARLNRRKIVVTRHHSDAVHTIPATWKRAGYLALESYINRSAHHLIAPSQMVYDILTGREHVPAEKVSKIPYGQKMERFNAIGAADVRRIRDEFAAHDSFLLVMVGRLFVKKGHRYLFDAFERFVKIEPRAKLILVGIGPSEQELRSDVAARGLGDRVHFALWRDDALAFIAAADMMVHSSLHEALPSAVIESLALARPIVVTDVSGVRDLIGESERGYLVPPADADAFFQAMRAAHAAPEEAKRRAELGRKHVFANLGADTVARQYVECYEKVMWS